MKFFLYTVLSLARRRSGWQIGLGSLAVLLFLHSSVIALPRFVVNSNHWEEKTRIFLANCPEQACLGEQVRLLKPKTHWAPRSHILDLTWVGPTKIMCPKTDKACLMFHHKMASRQSVIYGISATEDSPGVLYQFDAESGEELGTAVLPIPITAAFLLAEDVYFENAWHTFLVCTADSKDSPSQVFIWEVTNPASLFNKPLVLESFSGLVEDRFKMTARPCLLRYSDGHFGLTIPGRSQSITGLYFIHLQHLPKYYFLKIGAIPLTHVQAVDSNTQGYVDRLYCVDEQGVLWSMVLENSRIGQAKKIFTGLDPHFSRLTAVKSIQQPGRDLYYFGGDLEQRRGVFKGTEGVDNGEFKKQQILLGHFVDLWSRLGSLILIEPSSAKLPLVVSRRSPLADQSVPVTWKKEISAREEAAILQTLLLWDPHKRLETIITLNTQCQITLLQAAITGHHYGRVTWRKENENRK